MDGRSMPTGVAVLKWYFILYGILIIIIAFVLPPLMMMFIQTMQSQLGEAGADALAGGVMGGVMFVWSFFMICWGIFLILIGAFLGKGSGWARIAAIIVGILSLLSLPIGTILGIICLVVLFGEEGKAYFMR